MSNLSEAEAAEISTIETNYYIVAALSLYTYQHVIMFPQELRVVWGRRFTGVTFLLLLNRYLPFAIMTLDLMTSSTIPELNQHQSCVQQVVWLIIVQCIQTLVTTALPALRVYAIWGQSWICFVLVAIPGLVDAIVVVICTIPSTVYSLSPLISGCWDTPLPFTVPVWNSLELASFSSVIAREALVLVLTWLRTYQIQKLAAGANIKTRLSTLLLRDGTVYFGAILGLNVVVLVIYRYTDPISTVGIGIIYIERVMQAIPLSHLMFDLREAYLSDSSSSTSIAAGSRHRSTIRFNANIVGNIGAPLAEEWFEDTDDEQPPSPAVCDDPFAFGLIEEKTVEPGVHQNTSNSSKCDSQPASDRIASIIV